MTTVLHITQILLAIMLIGAVLLQVRTMGLGSVFGGQQATVFRTRRGFEKTLFQSTVVLTFLMVVTAILSSRLH